MSITSYRATTSDTPLQPPIWKRLQGGHFINSQFDQRLAPDGDRVAIIGGGIAGLSVAYSLAKAGIRVTLFEAADRFGGLGTYFEHDGHTFERFYHVILPTDDDLLGLADDLGLRDEIYWEESSLGFVYQGRLYPLARSTDLLRFEPVPFRDRLRLGFTALWAAHVARSDGLDDMTVADWLRRLSGKRAFNRLWRPLLQAKFGDAYDRIPALWYWAHFRREKGTSKEVKGYMRGGYRRFAEAIVAAAREAGAELHTGVKVDRVGLAPSHRGTGVELRIDGQIRAFDRAVLCTPFKLVPRLLDPATLGSRLETLPVDLDYQGVVNVLVMLRRSLSRHYWMPIVDSGVPFRGIVETTRVISQTDSGGRHLVYLLNYVHRDTAEFARSDEDLETTYLKGLLKLFPDLNADDVLSTHVFRTPYVEPIWTPGYSSRIPPAELVDGRIYLATTAQVYPRVTSWNSSIGLATRVVERILAP